VAYLNHGLGYTLDTQGITIDSCKEQQRLSIFWSVQTGSGAHPAFYSVGIVFFSPLVKQPEHKADHSPSSSAKIPNEWSCMSTLPYFSLLELGSIILSTPYVITILPQLHFRALNYGVFCTPKGVVVQSWLNLIKLNGGIFHKLDIS